jgi:hypothetical protein
VPQTDGLITVPRGVLHVEGWPFSPGTVTATNDTTRIYIENKVPCNVLNLVDEIIPFLTYDLGLVDKTCGGWSDLKRKDHCE